MDLRQIVGILLSRWKFVMVTLGLGSLITTALIFAVPPTYPSMATLLVSTRSTGVGDKYLQSLTSGQEYDVVIVVAPPFLPVADISILLTEADGALLLTGCGSASREQLRQAVTRIEAIGGRLCGTVLDRTPRRALGSCCYGYGPSAEAGFGKAATESGSGIGKSLFRSGGRRALR